MAPAFGQQWRPGPGAPGDVFPVTRPRALLNRGVKLVGCSGFAWGPSRVVYDMFVVDGTGKILRFSPQGERDMASVTVGGRRYYVHRLVCFNTAGVCNGRAWGNGQALACVRKHECHHYKNPWSARVRPWLNSRRRNMVALTRVKHARWHRQNPMVPWKDD